MLLTFSILCLVSATCFLHGADSLKRWHIRLHFLTAGGFLTGVGYALAAWWAWSI